VLAACSIIQPAATNYQSGLEHYQSGQFEESVAEFDQAIASDPQLGEAFGFRGLAHFHLGNMQLAQEDLDRAIELEAGSAEVFGTRGLLLAAEGDVEAALADLDGAIGFGLEDGEVFATRGMLLAASGDTEAALEDLSQAIELEFEGPEVFGQRGIILHEMGQDDDALGDLNRAIDLDSENPVVFYTRGAILNDQGDPDAALEDLNQAIELDGEYSAAYALRGLVHYDLDNFDESLADLNSAIAMDYESGAVHFVRGLILEDQQGLAAALDEFTSAIELGLEVAAVYPHRGQAYVEAGALQNALEDFSHAIELDADHAAAYRERALLFASVGEEESALEDFERAFDLGMEDGEMYETRADIFYTLGQYEAAVQDYNRVYEFGEPSVMIAEDFSYRGDWPSNNSLEEYAFGYSQERYQISVFRSNWIADMPYYDRNLRDVIIDVDTVFDTGPGYEYGWGVRCREHEGNAYSFVITSRGRYAIIRQTAFDAGPGRYVITANFLRGWSSANIINTEEDAANHITASCIGNTLTLEVNGNFLAEATDDEHTRGRVAMMAQTSGSIDLRVLFDNLIIRSEEPVIGALRGAIATEPVRNVLVVCDNLLPANDDFCSAAAIGNALDNLGYEATTISTFESGMPTLDLLNEYDVIFWSLGDDCCNSPHADGVQVIMEYLDQGGQLVIDGGSIALAWTNSSFLQNYLSADFGGFGNLVDLIPSQDGHPLLEGIEDPISLKRAPYTPDVISPLNDATVLFVRGAESLQAGEAAMIAYEDGGRRVIYAAFPLKELPSGILEQLLDNALNWFHGQAPL
jgi:tetratricopeptide (TPR) repeat protein